MTPKRTDECQTCGHPWAKHVVDLIEPDESETHCFAEVGFGWCSCPEFVLRELLPQLDQQP